MDSYTSVVRFAKFPIATDHEANQPRLILVAVDIADGVPVTFDSYPKEDGSRTTHYGKFVTQDNKETGFEHVIRYDKGITSDHVIASGSYPVNFDYASLEVENYDTGGSSIKNDARYIRKNSSNRNPNDPLNHYKKEVRYFWDGGLMANTPLSQLVLLHRSYWYKVRGIKDKVPTLDTCVINLHPTRQKEIPTDHDGVINRNSDIIFSDRTHREEEILLLISDYIDLIRHLIRVAKENKVKDEVIDNLLDQPTRYHGIVFKSRKYKDIVEGRFDIAEIIRIERKNDENTISHKTFDFSSGTIRQLLNDGYKDTIEYVNTRTN
jgi:predicted acylesterase/phospholipase RssA